MDNNQCKYEIVVVGRRTINHSYYYTIVKNVKSLKSTPLRSDSALYIITSNSSVIPRVDDNIIYMVYFFLLWKKT